MPDYLMNSLRSKLVVRNLSNARPAGRIFGNYNQAIDSNQASNIDINTNDSAIDLKEGSDRRMPESQFKTSTLSSFAFSEESIQDYSLTSFKDASTTPFPKEIVEVLSEPIPDDLIEIKPDGSCYLPEVQYRRILNKAFGLGGWSLIPRGPHSIQGNVISREYSLFANGRFISQARGHATITGTFQNPAMCTESVRSNSLMRCCKDLGIASSLWDHSLVSQWKAKFAIRKSVTDYSGRTKYVWEKKRSQDQY